MTDHPSSFNETAHLLNRASVTFQGGRTVVRVSDRVQWRIGLLTLVLSKSHGQRSTMPTLNLLLWAMQSPGTRDLLKRWWFGAEAADLATIRSDPGLDVTLDLAFAEQLVQVNRSGTVHLTERGKEMAALIDADIDLMAPEKALLSDMRPLNERRVRERLGGLISAT